MTGPGGAVVVKLGGSLMSGGDLDGLVAAIHGSPRPVAIVCGGGIFADAVRVAQPRLGFSDRLAHRLALDAMSHFAEVVAERWPDLRLVVDPGGIRTAFAEGRLALWHPAAIRTGHPDVPETWEVTSDSLALFVAREIGAARLLLVKSAEVEAVLSGSTRENGAPSTAERRILPRLVAAGYLDAAFPAFLARYSGIVRVLGPRDHARLGDALAVAGADVGTRIA